MALCGRFKSEHMPGVRVCISGCESCNTWEREIEALAYSTH